jgi:hypothetical protein
MPVQNLYQPCWPYKILSMHQRSCLSHLVSYWALCFFHYSSTISRAFLYHGDITCMHTTYNFTSADILQIMLIISEDSTSTLTIYCSGHCETAMVVMHRFLQLDDACQILLDNTIDFHQKVQKLGLIIETFHKQFTPIQTRQKLVTSLIVPHFLYCDVIFFKSSARLRERLKLALNSCSRYIYGISYYGHISTYINRILGVRICCMIHKLIKSGGTRYLFDELRFGQSSRLFNLKSHRTVWMLVLARYLFRLPSCGMTCNRPSKEEGAWGSLG